MRLRRRVVMGVALVAVLTAALAFVLVQRETAVVHSTVGDFALTAAAPSTASSPPIAQSAATSTALSVLANFTPAVSGYRVEAAHWESGLTQVTGLNGSLFSRSDGVDAWVLELSAPPPPGYTAAKAFAVVSAAGRPINVQQLLSK